MELTNYSQEYLNNTPIEYRKKMGQYFTISSLRKLVFNNIPQMANPAVLEPSCGSGEFIQDVMNKFDNCQIDAVELDENLYSHCKDKYPQVNIINHDALTYQYDKKYDLIVGNPPYYEFVANKKTKKQFGDVLSGRTNIYALFIKLSIDLLKEGGYLGFVVPTSMLNGSQFALLRKYIIKTCSIENIIVKDQNHFIGAQQGVMVLILKKGENDGNFIFEHNGISVFTPKWKQLKRIYSKCSTISELGYIVKTGTVVWNQHKEKLGNKGTFLVWSHNITNKGIVKTTKKPQYISGIKPLKKQVIAVNRIVGKGGKLRACLSQNKIYENHVNIIIPDSPLIEIKDLLSKIMSKRSMIIMNNIIGNTQISKTELERIFPIFM